MAVTGTQEIDMKPKWMNTSPGDKIAKDALRKAAKALREDARLYKRERSSEEARALRRAAVNLEYIANGATWADAFELGG